MNNTINLNGVTVDVNDLRNQLEKAGFNLTEKPKPKRPDYGDGIFVGTDDSIAIGLTSWTNFDELLGDVLKVMEVIKVDRPELFNTFITQYYNCYNMSFTNATLCDIDKYDSKDRNLICACLIKMLLGKLNSNSPGDGSYYRFMNWLENNINIE